VYFYDSFLVFLRFSYPFFSLPCFFFSFRFYALSLPFFCLLAWLIIGLEVEMTRLFL